MTNIQIYLNVVSVVQVIFGELFQLPVPPHIDVMYTTLLIELCKLQPGSLPQVVSLKVVYDVVNKRGVYEAATFLHTPCLHTLFFFFYL